MGTNATMDGEKPNPIHGEPQETSLDYTTLPERGIKVKTEVTSISSERINPYDKPSWHVVWPLLGHKVGTLQGFWTLAYIHPERLLTILPWRSIKRHINSSWAKLCSGSARLQPQSHRFWFVSAQIHHGVPRVAYSLQSGRFAQTDSSVMHTSAIRDHE